MQECSGNYGANYGTMDVQQKCAIYTWTVRYTHFGSGSCVRQQDWRTSLHDFTHDQPLFYGAVSSKRAYVIPRLESVRNSLDTVESKLWSHRGSMGIHLYIGDFPLPCFSTESKFFQEFRTALSFLAVLKSFNSTKIGTVLSIGHMWNLAPSLWLGEIHQGH